MAKLTGKAKAKFLARMKKGRKAAMKKGGGKKTSSKRKTLEKRLVILETQLQKMLSEQGFDPSGMANVRRDPKFSAGMETRERMKKELDAGDW